MPSKQHDSYSYLKRKLTLTPARGCFLIRARFYDGNGSFISYSDITAMNPGSITTWTRVGGRVTAPATAATMDVQYLLYQSSGWVNIDDVEVTAVAPPANYVTKYYYFNGQRVAMRVNGVLTYLHTDHLGSTVLETNASGTVINDEKYRAFGKQRDTGIVGTDYQFTGQKQDASGLVYMNARFFDPLTGMFVSPDTIVPDPGNVFAYNRSMYVYGRVMNANDPSGHCGSNGISVPFLSADSCGGGGGINPYYVAKALEDAIEVGYAAAVIANNLNSDQGEKVTPTAPPVLGPQPKPATQTGTQTWLPLSDGMDISIPGTKETGVAAPQDPGFSSSQPNVGDNIMVAGSTPSGLRNASAGLKELYSSGSVKGNSIINIRETLKGNGFTGGITKNRQGYLFTNNTGEKVRIMYRNGKWDLRVQNADGNYLDEYGNVADPNNSHSIYVESK